MKVLVCEDDQAIASLIELLLHEEGHHVRQCTNATGVLPSIASFKPDLIILDYWLNDVKADKIMEQIRDAETSENHLPVILVSAINNLPQVAKELEADDYLEKPFDIDTFHQKVKIVQESLAL